MPKFETGDVLNGYRILEPFRRANGGNCEWTFAERGGETFFIKNFFKPKYPVARNGKPPAGDVAGRLARCNEFEEHQTKLMNAASRVGGAGGRLVVPTDFFRSDAIYYKVARKVDAVGLEVDEIARLPIEQKQSIMGAVISALRALHNAKIVHGDLSQGNILITSRGDSYIANVIDFDSSFLDGDPPPKEETMGNPPYYSPELLTYLQEEDGDGSKLTTASDIFALGVVFWEYLYGRKPEVSAPFNYACEAVRAGQPLPDPAGSDVPPGARTLLQSMLSNDPAARPTMMTIQQAIRKGFVDRAAIEEAAREEAERLERERKAAEEAVRRASEEEARRLEEERRKSADPSDPGKRINARSFGAKRRSGEAPVTPATASRPDPTPPPADPSTSRIKFRKRGD